MGEIIPWESLSRVTYTGIKSMHSQKTMQPCWKNRTRKKKSTVEDAWKIPEKNKKNEPSEQLKSTKSLKRERPKNNHTKKELSIWKRTCKLLRTETLKIGRAKNKPDLKKLTSERIRALQTAQKTTPHEKSWVEDGSGKEREKVTFKRGKRALHKRKQSYYVVKGAKPLRRIAG